jgi:predicted dehydrogenase
MFRETTRRQFLQTSSAAGIGFWIAGGVQAQESKSPNERIAMASIGIGGKGSSDSDDAGKRGDMVAICDVDEGRLNVTGEKRFPKAKRYTDFRKLLEEMGKSIDAVTVSTTDHTHAPAALMAMRMGKHCFCQKPLTRTIYEARLMGKVAREMKVATQMGNQGTASSGLRRSAAWLRAGVLGSIREIHIWTNRPIWPQGGNRPAPSECPKTVNWDLWLGPAPERPYAKGYHPFAWRGWWDFGSGALGDMGCHNINMAFMGLDLRNPVSIQAETAGHNKDSFPAWSIVTYEFAAADKRPALKMVWYDGGKLPAPEVLDGLEAGKGGGSLVIGEKGRLFGDRLIGVQPVDVSFPESPGHFDEWTQAIKGGPTPMSNFPDYAAPLTETVLLGNLAVWAAASGKGEKVEWDAANLKAKNVAGLETLLKPVYRKGYVLDV